MAVLAVGEHWSRDPGDRFKRILPALNHSPALYDQYRQRLARM